MDMVTSSGIVASRICKTVGDELRAVNDGVPFRTGFRGSEEFKLLCVRLMGIAKERRYFISNSDVIVLHRVYPDWVTVMISEGFGTIQVLEPESGIVITW